MSPFIGTGIPLVKEYIKDVSWKMLNAVIDTEEWMTPLKEVKGVYLLTDANTGLMYVGSATGERKLWGRWKSYIRTGHGGNEGLKKLSKKYIKEKDLEKFRSFFIFFNIKPDICYLINETARHY